MSTGKKSRVPEYDSVKASRRFLRNLVWVLVVGGLFLAGQGVRYWLNYSQLMEIRQQTRKLYQSVLGRDIGSSPYGRLQFEHGKLSAVRGLGLDPLSVLAALSRPDSGNVRLEGVSFSGPKGRVHGFFSGTRGQFNKYFDMLTDDDQWLFSLYRIIPDRDGLTFTLTVEGK